MNFLTLERSSSTPGAALYRDGTLLAATTFPAHPASLRASAPPRAAREDARPPVPLDSWASSVNALFVEASVAPAELSAILLAIGPGSFSGIRAAIAFAQGLALPHPHIKILGVSTAAVIAWQELRLATEGATCTVVGDARREHIWQACFQRTANGLSGGEIALHPYASWDTGRNACAPLSPDADRLLAISANPTDGKDAVATFPSAEGLATLYLADPDSFIENPLPIYLHNAV